MQLTCKLCIILVANNYFFVFYLADIVFIVKDKPHPVFKRDNDNLIYTASVPLGKVSLVVPNEFYLHIVAFLKILSEICWSQGDLLQPF